MGSHLSQAPWRKVAAPVLLATHLAACTSWRVENVPPAQLLQTKAPYEVQVTRADSSTVVLAAPQVAADSLQGWSHGTQLSIPMTDIHAIATRHRDAVMTTVLTAGVVGALVAIVVVPAVCIASRGPLASC